MTLNSREILQHAGRVSHDMAKEFAEREYDKFHQKRIDRIAAAPSDFDRAVQVLPAKRAPRTKRVT